MKLIPAEVIALYLSFKSVMRDSEQLALWGLICLLLVLIVRAAGTYQTGGNIQYMAVLVAAVSFILWVYAMEHSIKWLAPLLGWLKPPFISVAIAVWTLLVPYLYKGD